jgi:phage terminase large subunit-like protein
MKTELMAAIGLEKLAGPTAPPSPEVRIAAASFEQADTLFGSASVMVTEGPLAPFFHVFDTEIRPKDQPGVLKRIAAAAGTTDGGRTTCFIADELHEWTGGRERVHLVNSNSLAKREAGLELNISTAGYDRDTLLGQLYDHGRRIASGEVSDQRFLFEWWESTGNWDLSDPAQLLSAIVEANPVCDSWLTPERVAERFRDPEVPMHEAVRYYLNRWAVAPSRWMAPDPWDAQRRAITVADGTPIVIGFDGSASRDNTALVAMTLEGHAWPLGVWERDPHRPDWRVPREAVHARLADAMNRYDVRLLLCDPAGWTAEIEGWAAEFGAERVVVFPQTNERMAPAADRFRAGVVNGEITHSGDPTLTRNVLNAITRETRWGLAIGKDHRDSPRKVDAAVAAVLADAARALAMAAPQQETEYAW